MITNKVPLAASRWEQIFHSMLSRLMDKTLRNVFGFDSFRPNQRDIVEAILQKRDILAVMPTGGGKSLCYQLPAILQKGVCIVISPLLSLMKDQVDSITDMGIHAAALNSNTSRKEFNTIVQSLEQGRLKLLYLSPERFNSPSFLPWIQQNEVSFFAVDEAHCISQWGHNFRKDYLALSKIVHEFPNTPIAAFTATATSYVSDDIIKQLRLRNPLLVRASFDRPNLYYQMAHKDHVKEQLLNFLRENEGESGIVYCGTRKKVEETADRLIAHDFKARGYHAGMSDLERNDVQNAFANDEVQIIVATIAFGMGIDKSNVRFVVHLDLPKNIEGYYQETGRAGRDGTNSKCLLLFGYQDILLLKSFIKDDTDPVHREAETKQLNAMVQFAEADQCRRKGLLQYFGEQYESENCGQCDYCCGDILREDATLESQKLLSAIQRTGNRFGAGHVIDVLVGANSEKVRKFQHNQLSTYGIGKDRPRRYWSFLLSTLALKGIVDYDSLSEYPVVKVTDLGWQVMRSQLPVQLIKLPDFKKRKPQQQTSQDIRAAILTQERKDNRELFEQLRLLRTQLAQTKKVPPYVIFSDKSLLDMVRLRPVTQTEFLAVQGVGQNKMDRYGADFLQIIRSFQESAASRHG